jgi:hypothetical protein
MYYRKKGEVTEEEKGTKKVTEEEKGTKKDDKKDKKDRPETADGKPKR